jgi:hypothetical protein
LESASPIAAASSGAAVKAAEAHAREGFGRREANVDLRILQPRSNLRHKGNCLHETQGSQPWTVLAACHFLTIGHPPHEQL